MTEGRFRFRDTIWLMAESAEDGFRDRVAFGDDRCQQFVGGVDIDGIEAVGVFHQPLGDISLQVGFVPR